MSGRFTLQMTVFYAGSGPVHQPERPWPMTPPRRTSSSGSTSSDPSAPIDSVAKRRRAGQSLPHLARRSGRAASRPQVSVDVSALGRARRSACASPGPITEGRCASAWTTFASSRSARAADDRVELLVTPRPSSAVDLVLHRMTQADALAALAARAAEARPRRSSSPAPCSSPGTARSCSRTPGAGPTARLGTANTPATRFRIGSMNKMFTAVATLQLVEAGQAGLDDPIGKHLPDYPNKEVAAKVTVRHLLTHTGGTGDIFGPEFEQHRLQLREHRDYLKLYGSARARPRSRVPASSTPTTASSCSAPSSKRSAGSRITTTFASHVFRPAGMTVHGLASRIRGGPEPSGRLHAVMPLAAIGCRIPTPALAGHGGRRRLLDRRRPPALRPGAELRKADLQGDASPKRPVPTSSSTGTASACKAQGSLRSYGHGGGAPGMNGELRVFPELGYVVVSLSNLDPPAASEPRRVLRASHAGPVTEL